MRSSVRVLSVKGLTRSTQLLGAPGRTILHSPCSRPPSFHLGGLCPTPPRPIAWFLLFPCAGTGERPRTQPRSMPRRPKERTRDSGTACSGRIFHPRFQVSKAAGIKSRSRRNVQSEIQDAGRMERPLLPGVGAPPTPPPFSPPPSRLDGGGHQRQNGEGLRRSSGATQSKKLFSHRPSQKYLSGFFLVDE